MADQAPVLSDGFLRDPNGAGSSKRLVGFVALLGVLLAIVADAIHPGAVADASISTLAYIAMTCVGAAAVDHFAPRG